MSENEVRLDRRAEGAVRQAFACAGLNEAPEDAVLSDLLPRPIQRQALMSVLQGQLAELTGLVVTLLPLVLFDGATTVGNLIVEVEAFLSAPDAYLEP